MARYRGPVEKIERRFGVSLNLKGERRLAGKSALEKLSRLDVKTCGDLQRYAIAILRYSRRTYYGL